MLFNHTLPLAKLQTFSLLIRLVLSSNPCYFNNMNKKYAIPQWEGSPMTNSNMNSNSLSLSLSLLYRREFSILYQNTLSRDRSVQMITLFFHLSERRRISTYVETHAFSYKSIQVKGENYVLFKMRWKN